MVRLREIAERGRQTYEKYDRINTLIEMYTPVEPRPDLVPLGNGFYTTPTADPMNCDQYPDSPYCGGNPLGGFAELEAKIVLDECNIGVELEGSFGFVRMPPAQIVYRRPGRCRRQDFLDLPDINETLPPSVPEVEANQWILVTQNYEYEQYLQYQTWSEVISERIVHYVSYDEQPGEIIFDTEEIYTWRFNGKYMEAYWNGAVTINELLNEGLTVVENAGEDFTSYDSVYRYTFRDRRQGRTTDRNSYHVRFFYGDREALLQYLEYYNIKEKSLFFQADDVKIAPPVPLTEESLIVPGQYETRLTLQEENNPIFGNILWAVGKDARIEHREYITTISPLMALNNKLDRFDPRKRPPPPNNRMSCCPKVNESNDLLKLIAKRLGVSDYPVNVPKVLTDRSKGTEKLENITRFTSYVVRQLDALCGKYPIDIKIEDIDLTQEGNQEQTIKVPNVAEALAEILGLLLTLRSESHANLSATIRGMIEAGSAKQSAILAHDFAKANAEYLGYKLKQVERKVPYAFIPGKERLDEMLEEGEISVVGYENDDPEGIQEDFAPLLEMAAMYRAQNYRNLGASDPSINLRKILGGAARLVSDIDTGTVADLLKKYYAKPQEEQTPEELEEILKKGKDSWDAFTESAEQGFIDKPGITNTTKPYSRPYNQRPRIREIGEDTSDTSN